MLFNGTINVIDVETNLSEQDGTKFVELGLIAGITVPTPQGIAVIPGARLKVPFVDREQLESVADNLKELAQELPTTSDIQTASNMSDVEAAAERLERIKQGGKPNAN